MHCSKYLKCTLCLIIAAVMTFGFFGIKPAYIDAHAQSISSMKEKVNELEGQKSSLKTKIDKLEGDVAEQQEYLDSINAYISAVENKIMTCENLLSSYQGEIDKYNNDIKSKKKELQKNKVLFQRRIRSIYMSGSNTSMSLLLGSDYFADYLSISQFTAGLAKYDNALMTKINKTLDVINSKIKKKNEAMDEQKEIKEQLASDRADLQSKSDEANTVLSGINKSKSQLQNELKQVESSISSLEGDIDAAYEAARQAALQAQQNGEAPKVNYNGNGFAWPLPGYSTITSQFGMRFDPYYKCYRGHNGIDISGGSVAGKPIVASASGTVTVAEFNNGGYGNYVVISHGMVSGSLITTHYGHMMSYAVSVGQKVNQGDVIGYVGTTGASTGYHLHFEVRLDNSPVNPFNYVSY